MSATNSVLDLGEAHHMGICVLYWPQGLAFCPGNFNGDFMSFIQFNSNHSFQFLHFKSFQLTHVRSETFVHFMSCQFNSFQLTMNPISHVSFSKRPPRRVPGTTWHTYGLGLTCFGLCLDMLSRRLQTNPQASAWAI